MLCADAGRKDLALGQRKDLTCWYHFALQKRRPGCCKSPGHTDVCKQPVSYFQGPSALAMGDLCGLSARSGRRAAVFLSYVHVVFGDHWHKRL